MKGLYEKFQVVKRNTGEEVKNCFVLRPETDRDARAALRAYASSVREDDPELAMQLTTWMDELDIEDGVTNEEA